MSQHRRLPFLLCFLSFLLVSSACGVTDDAPSVAAGSSAVTAAVPLPPPISQVLACGTPASAGGLTRALELQRVDLNVATFPGARCNDGTPATFYFRPGTTVAGKERWVIQLQGGGGCRTPDSCAQRWCSVDTNFGMTQMTSTLAPADGIRADGILERSVGFPNPMATWNQVFVRYCSSDTWSGSSGPVAVDSHDPITGAPVTFRIEFNGRSILDAVVKMLRRDGTGPLTYTFGGSVQLPDLDTAKTVVLAGASAGGGGVINNADYLGDVLRTNNPCQGVGCLEYRALIDSAFGPEGASLDWTTSTTCLSQGLCTWQQQVASGSLMYDSHGDTSCETWHAANDPANAWRCDDTDHSVRHHVTTPMLVRMGLIDQLISGNLIDSGVTVPGRGPMTLALFTERVRAELLALGGLVGAEEGASMSPPALYGPVCSKHETISNNPSVYGVTIGVGGVRKTMFDILSTWRAGGTPIRAVQAQGDLIDCQ
jgi:hypothetical protein